MRSCCRPNPQRAQHPWRTRKSPLPYNNSASSGLRPNSKSDIEFTTTRPGLRQLKGSSIAWSWKATPNPGPLVRESPSACYFAEPIAFNRMASVST